MSVAIVTDSNSGIFEEEGAEKGIFIIPMPIIIDGLTFYEGVDLTYEAFYHSLVDNKKVSSSQPSPGDVLAKWEYIFCQGFDEILYIPMSSGLSSSYSTARVLSMNYPDKVYVVDNHRISVTQRHSIQDAVSLAEKGYTAKEIKEILEKNAYESIIFVGVETLEYLKKGGRVTPAGAAMGSILHIKPLLIIEGERLDAFAKIRGTKKCQRRLIEEMKKKAETYYNEGAQIRISAASSILDKDKNAEWISMVQKAFKDETVHYDPLTFSIGCHVGPGAFGMGISKAII